MAAHRRARRPSPGLGEQSGQDGAQPSR
jgi:hypothetical protein